MGQWPHLELVNASSIPSVGRLVAAHPLRGKGLVTLYFFIAKFTRVR